MPVTTPTWTADERIAAQVEDALGGDGWCHYITHSPHGTDSWLRPGSTCYVRVAKQKNGLHTIEVIVRDADHRSPHGKVWIDHETGEVAHIDCRMRSKRALWYLVGIEDKHEIETKYAEGRAVRPY